VLCPPLDVVEQRARRAWRLGFEEAERGEVVAMRLVVQMVVDGRNASDDAALPECEQQLHVGMGENGFFSRPQPFALADAQRRAPSARRRGCVRRRSRRNSGSRRGR
jgi:hypothetical protein